MGFAKRDVSPDLDGFYSNNKILSMLEGKEFEALDFVFQSVGAFLDPVTGKERDHAIIWAHTMFPSLNGG